MSSRSFFEGFEPLHSGEEGDELIIPRSFFERVVITEPASTIRVVAFILLRTLEGQTEVEASYTDFVKELRLCRQSVQEGLARAIEAGYIRQVQTGENAHVKSRYVICWATPSPSPPPSPDGGSSNNNNSPTNTNHTNNNSSSGRPTTHTNSTIPPVRKNQNATTQPATQPTKKQTGTISSTLTFLPTALDSISTPLINKVSMIKNRTVESVESGVPARKSDRQPQRHHYSSTFPTTTTTIISPATTAATTTMPSHYHDSGAPISSSSPFPSSPTPSSTPTPTPTKPALTLSSYLSHLSQDISREFGDISHTSSNRAQTHNLWHHSGLSQTEFAAKMYQARELTRRYAILRVGEAPPPPGQPRNRMPYFFVCLRDLLGLRREAATNTKKSRSSSSSSSSRYSSHRDQPRSSSNLNDQAANSDYPYSSAVLPSLPSSLAWQPNHEQEAAVAQLEPLPLPEEMEQQLEQSAYTGRSKLNYKSGSTWREAQALTAETDFSPTARPGDYALTDSSVELASCGDAGSIVTNEADRVEEDTIPALLVFPHLHSIKSSYHRFARSYYSDYSNNTSWNGQSLEHDDGTEEEDETENKFTTDHTTALEMGATFEPENVADVGNSAVPSWHFFRGAEAQRREQYLAQSGRKPSFNPDPASQAARSRSVAT